MVARADAVACRSSWGVGCDAVASGAGGLGAATVIMTDLLWSRGVGNMIRSIIAWGIPALPHQDRLARITPLSPHPPS